jgi:cyanophycinase
MRWLVLGLILVSIGESSPGDDKNPLNLPRPAERGKIGAVILHGGGPLSDEIFERFIELAGGREARIVLIPSGTYVRGWDEPSGREFNETTQAFLARLSRRFGSWVELKRSGRIADFRFLFTDNQTDSDDPAFVAALGQATGVWIPAKYQGKLDWRFAPQYPKRTSLFQEALRRVVARGGVVGGLGGGMSALPEVMIMGDTSASGGPAEAYLRPGLALFNGAIVDQNFDARGGRLERFTGLLKDTDRLNERISWPAAGRSMIGLAVEREGALLLRGSTIAALGEKHGHVFLKRNGDRTVTWRILSPKDGAVDLVAASSTASSRASTVATTPADGATRSARAEVAAFEKNPFGMPWPPAGGTPGTVVLHGGGPNSEIVQVYPRLAGSPRSHYVHCPAASWYWRPRAGVSRASLNVRLNAYYSDWADLVKDGRLASLTFLTTSSADDANDARFVAPLRKAGAVWFSGGNQGVLAYLFADAKAPTLFQKELAEVVRRGGVVGGTSAGAAAMAGIMTVSGESTNGEPAQARIDHGLGILSNVIIEQHLNGNRRAGRIERFTGLLRDNERLRTHLGKDTPAPERMIGLAIEEGTALLLTENRLKVVGRKHAHVFLKSADQKTITWHELSPGDAAYITQTAAGPVLELDGWRVR